MTDADEVSELCHALAHPYRRVACYYLDEHGEASLTTLADCVTGWVQSDPGSDAPADYDAVRAQLHHVHLPILADAELVTYDPVEQGVAFESLSTAATELLESALRADADGGGVQTQRATTELGGERASEDEDAS